MSLIAWKTVNTQYWTVILDIWSLGFAQNVQQKLLKSETLEHLALILESRSRFYFNLSNLCICCAFLLVGEKLNPSVF